MDDETKTGIAPDGSIVTGRVVDWADGKPVVQLLPPKDKPWLKGEAVAIIPLDKEQQRMADLEDAFRRMGYRDHARQPKIIR